MIERHPDLKKYEMGMEPVPQIPGLEIYLDRRKTYLPLKGKLFAVSPCSSFDIRCVRSVGYCLELLTEE